MTRHISALKIPLDRYKEVTRQHFINEMPIILLAGEIFHRGDHVEVNDKSGAFHFENDHIPRFQLPDTVAEDSAHNSVAFDKNITRIYDQRLCVQQILRTVGLTGDLVKYVPKVHIDMSRDPRLNTKQKKENMLILSESGTAAATAIGHSINPSTIDLCIDIFSAATNSKALTIADALH